MFFETQCSLFSTRRRGHVTKDECWFLRSHGWNLGAWPRQGENFEQLFHANLLDLATYKTGNIAVSRLCFFAGQNEEAPGVWWNRVRLDLHARTWDNHWCTEQRHYQGSMCAVGRSQQLCHEEDNGFLNPLLCIPLATGGDDLLLLQNCPHHKTQSNSPPHEDCFYLLQIKKTNLSIQSWKSEECKVSALTLYCIFLVHCFIIFIFISMNGGICYLYFVVDSIIFVIISPFPFLNYLIMFHITVKVLNSSILPMFR